MMLCASPCNDPYWALNKSRRAYCIANKDDNDNDDNIYGEDGNYFLDFNFLSSAQGHLGTSGDDDNDDEDNDDYDDKRCCWWLLRSSLLNLHRPMCGQHIALDHHIVRPAPCTIGELYS